MSSHGPPRNYCGALKTNLKTCVKGTKLRVYNELICRGHILNALSDRLYDLYTNTYSTREIWEALENKYKAEEEGTKKFLISQYIDFKFFDEKPLLPQIHELQLIVNKLKVLKIELPEAFQVGAIMAKLPSSWKGYRKRILHNSEDYSLEDIQKHLRIKEESRSRDKMVEPPRSKPIGCKWVFRRKYHTDGMIQTFKARLVAKGFKQREGIDYFDTYAPVARTTSIRILFALTSIHNLFVHQMDVKTAFLNGDLNEEVYMEQPEGFVLLENENKVCKLVKSLYGLKQAPKQWHEKFDHAILSNGFIHNNVDKCLYSKTCDDYMVIWGYALNQTHYIEKVVSKFSHLKIKDVNTPFDSSIKLEKNDGRSVAQLEYASAIGSLMYAAQCTRADISFAVSKLSRFISNPSVEHWKAIGRVLGYQKNTKELSLQYSKLPAILEGYSDASWISSVRDNLSTTGWVFTLGGGAVSWGSKKQTCISHSTMEAEFIALAAIGKEAEWLRDLMMDIPFAANNVSTVSIHCDSQATLTRAYSGVYNGKSRHINIRHEYVRQLIQYGIISISFVRSSGNLTDPFTKPLTRDLVRIHLEG
ncbi:Retrovirus-related Pol polyprotein from transposon TNT 1-94 [Vitis vinifera]|uniref:Retrovirus-related Pol polyprotein from transposon TNT 1-94 n=1 Tax=Vitis vinifera TaxID=29760 RepID=A0A438J0X1_VITVI|nr:Retrovirus-related Pol polyprotein from transposon TNT 1-94 [Vitis vinifera]